MSAQVGQVDEGVGLAAQVVGGHRRLRLDGGDHGHPHALALHRLDQPAEVAVAGEQHHVVDVRPAISIMSTAISMSMSPRQRLRPWQSVYSRADLVTSVKPL